MLVDSIIIALLELIGNCFVLPVYYGGYQSFGLALLIWLITFLISYWAKTSGKKLALERFLGKKSTFRGG
jgi:hypothetical protein